MSNTEIHLFWLKWQLYANWFKINFSQNSMHVHVQWSHNIALLRKNYYFFEFWTLLPLSKCILWFVYKSQRITEIDWRILQLNHAINNAHIANIMFRNNFLITCQFVNFHFSPFARRQIDFTSKTLYYVTINYIAKLCNS